VSGRVLLVGGTGFLGSFVAACLAERNPLVLVRPTSDRSALPAPVEPRVGDLDRALDLNDVESVVYCASMGFGHVPPLVAQLEAAGVRRGVFVSTTAIFTSLPTRSQASRVEAEDAVRSSHLAWTILRPTMIYGTARDRNISRLLRFLARWPVFPMCGGDSLWQPVHVEDVADAVVAALDAPQAIGRAYNVAGAAPLTFRDLVRTAARAVGRRVALVPVPLRAAVLAARLSHVVRPEQILRLAEDKVFDITVASADLGYAPRTFAEGVRSEAHLLGLAPRGYDQGHG
jgi:nucleoside-diphosphate-sugar epimerase